MNKIFLLVLTLMLIFTGCSGQYSFQEKEFENGLDLEVQVDSEDKGVSGNVEIEETKDGVKFEGEIIKEDNSDNSFSNILVERLESDGTVYIKNIDLKGIKAEVTISDNQCIDKVVFLESDSISKVNLLSCNLNSGKDYDVVVITDTGVYQTTLIAKGSTSLDVGRQSQEKITTDIEVVQVYATDTSDGSIDDEDSITMVIRLGSGSAPVKLHDLLIKLDTRIGSQTVQYNDYADFEKYSISYISGKGEAVSKGYLSTGDLAQITFLNKNNIEEGETATIRLLTKNGAVKPVDLTTPSAMTQVTTYLFP